MVNPWAARSACTLADSEAFFSERPELERRAKRICASCPVLVDCLWFALTDADVVGVWGGTTSHQRRTILRDLWTARSGPRRRDVERLVAGLFPDR